VMMPKPDCVILNNFSDCKITIDIDIAA